MKHILLALCMLAASRQAVAPPEMIPVQWLEPADTRGGADFPSFKKIPAGDPRLGQAERLIDNEAARFVRTLIAGAWRLTAEYGGTQPLPPLPIVLQPGGNNARSGFYLVDESGRRLQADLPYVLVDLDADRLSLTLLHEGGHVADRIVRRGTRTEATWSSLPHSTFAVTDPVTALSEGFAIQLETMWGHYGSDAERRAFYERLDPRWTSDPPVRGEFFTGVRDLMNFSQTWARYSAVRDGLAIFEGHVYDGQYLRSQYDPARDAARLKTANAAISSEGVIAAILFWTADDTARNKGAAPGHGLAQSGVLEGELQVLRALAGASAAEKARTIDIADVVVASGAAGSDARRRAIERFVALTRGVTANAEVRRKWRALYANASALDIQTARAQITELDRLRGSIVEEAMKDPTALRTQIGPVLPVGLEGTTLRLVALGEGFPAQFDLNAMSTAELGLLAATSNVRSRIATELDRAPFTSYEDFAKRSGVTLASLGAKPVKDK